jgi:phosphotransferase family enzyme
VQGPDEREMQSWRILLVGRNGAEVLLFRSPAGLDLPELGIPRWQRPAPLLNAEAERLWKVKTVCISPLELPASAPKASAPYYVMELLRPEQLLLMAPGSVDMSQVQEASFRFPADYAAVRQVMGEKGKETADTARGPFSDNGSFRRISSWVEQQLNQVGLHWDGSFRQLHSDASFALIRFSTNQGAFWFKAVGEPNLREFPVTIALAERFRRHIPRLLAVCPEWNAWLSPEAEGQELSLSTTPAAWHQVAESLAELQVASIGHVPEILTAGAHDVRSDQLVELADSFFCAMEETMEAQTRTGPQKLSRQAIRKVRNRVKEVLRQLDDTGIPDSLNHLDLNPGNVFTTESRAAFLDWAEAGIGNPFLSFEYLRQHFLRRFPRAEDADRQLSDCYQKPWAQFLPDTAVGKALLLIPLVAVFAYASRLPWNDASLSRTSHFAGYLRSMVRRMHHESELLGSRAR